MLYTKLVLRVPRLILYFVQLFSFVPIQGLFYDTPSDKWNIHRYSLIPCSFHLSDAKCKFRKCHFGLIVL